ncbi:MAG: alpha/beta fold hydrolase [Acidobacteriota bacterium]
MQLTRIFIHGLESSGSGTKGSFFHQRYPGMIVEDYTGSFEQRMNQLQEILDGKNNLIMVGSSFGGLMAAVYACLQPENVQKLILLAPALHLDAYKPYHDKKLKIPTTIYHGLQDDVVPLQTVKALSENIYLNLSFNTVQDDHVLHRTFPALDWDALLKFR